jgi:hypothetical protein
VRTNSGELTMLVFAQKSEVSRTPNHCIGRRSHVAPDGGTAAADAQRHCGHGRSHRVFHAGQYFHGTHHRQSRSRKRGCGAWGPAEPRATAGDPRLHYRNSVCLADCKDLQSKRPLTCAATARRAISVACDGTGVLRRGRTFEQSPRDSRLPRRPHRGFTSDAALAFPGSGAYNFGAVGWSRGCRCSQADWVLHLSQ